MSHEHDEDAGPWGVYDCYCLRCSTRTVTVAPVGAEAVDLWECPNCGEMSLTHVLVPAKSEAA